MISTNNKILEWWSQRLITIKSVTAFSKIMNLLIRKINREALTNHSTLKTKMNWIWQYLLATNHQSNSLSSHKWKSMKYQHQKRTSHHCYKNDTHNKVKNSNMRSGIIRKHHPSNKNKRSRRERQRLKQSRLEKTIRGQKRSYHQLRRHSKSW